MTEEKKTSISGQVKDKTKADKKLSSEQKQSLIKGNAKEMKKRQY